MLKVLLAFLFVPIVASAVNIDESLVCSPPKVSLSSIVCCETLPTLYCTDTIKNLAPSEQNEFLTNLTADLLTYPPEKKNTVDGFRAALELTGTHLPDPFDPANLNDFEAALESHYKEIFSTDQMQIGDLIVFDEQGDFLFSDKNPAGDHMILTWQKASQIIHAMVYVGGGLVLQKESVTDAASISTLEHAFVHYNYGVQVTTATMYYVAKKTSLVIRIFRKVA